MIKLARYFRKIYNLLRFGNITKRVTCTAGDGVPAEIEYIDCEGIVVGFWAYGYWEPNSPYKEGP